ncbi:phage head closure protein [Azorhizobium sp. AG788]|uniref:phage head closure protein n=1 Tax=Azorhizobium sp. AG788 TaxID=2183897 RepID=UPI003138B1C8
MTGAGDLNRRMRFEARAVVADDGYGNTEGAWTEQFTIAAKVKPLRGGESVLAMRLSGTQPVVMTVRQSAQTRAIRADWRAVDAHSGEVFALTSPPTDMDGTRAWLDILATSGIAA